MEAKLEIAGAITNIFASVTVLALANVWDFLIALAIPMNTLILAYVAVSNRQDHKRVGGELDNIRNKVDEGNEETRQVRKTVEGGDE